jgi:hypothetical protein
MLADEPGGERGHSQRSEADAGDGDTQSDGSPTLEPSGDRADHRHIDARGPNTGADSVRDAGDPQCRRHGGAEKPGAHDRGAHQQQCPGTVAVGGRARHDAEQEVQRHREREHRGRRAPPRPEFGRHAVEHHAVAVGDAEGHAVRQEGHEHDQPPA